MKLKSLNLKTLFQCALKLKLEIIKFPASLMLQIGNRNKRPVTLNFRRSSVVPHSTSNPEATSRQDQVSVRTMLTSHPIGTHGEREKELCQSSLVNSAARSRTASSRIVQCLCELLLQQTYHVMLLSEIKDEDHLGDDVHKGVRKHGPAPRGLLEREPSRLLTQTRGK